MYVVAYGSCVLEDGPSVIKGEGDGEMTWTTAEWVRTSLPLSIFFSISSSRFFHFFFKILSSSMGNLFQARGDPRNYLLNLVE